MKQIDDIIEQIREKNMECRCECDGVEEGRKVWRYVAAAACVALIFGMVMLWPKDSHTQTEPLLAGTEGVTEGSQCVAQEDTAWFLTKVVRDTMRKVGGLLRPNDATLYAYVDTQQFIHSDTDRGGDVFRAVKWSEASVDALRLRNEVRVWSSDAIRMKNEK